jgi:chorismate synthase
VAEKWLSQEHGTKVVSWVSSVMDIDIPAEAAQALEQNPPTREEIDTIGTLAEDEKNDFFIDMNGQKYRRSDGSPFAAGEAPQGLDFAGGKKLYTRCPHPLTAARMAARIQQLRREEDSTGGVCACVVSNVPVGLGEPCFDKL